MIPSTILTVGALAPTSFQHLLHTRSGVSSSMPWETLRAPVCGDPGQCPGLVQSHSPKGGWSQLSSHRMSQGKAWALLLWDTKASLLSKAGERFKKHYSTDNYESRFNFPVEIIHIISLPMSSRSAIKPQSPHTLIRDSIGDLWLRDNNWKPLITQSRRKTVSNHWLYSWVNNICNYKKGKLIKI